MNYCSVFVSDFNYGYIIITAATSLKWGDIMFLFITLHPETVLYFIHQQGLKIITLFNWVLADLSI